jgi:hypothetical protein
VAQRVGHFTVDTSDFTKFAKALKTANPVLQVELRRNLRSAGETVAAAIRRRASFSQRIPGSVKVQTRLASVAVTAGGKAAPDAAPIENKGKGHVRHPVFGNRAVWTDKNSPPAFFRPGLAAGGPAAAVAGVEALEAAVHEVVRAYGR